MADKLEPLFEQLEKDKAAAGLNDQGEKDDKGQNPPSKSGTDAGKSGGNNAARERISARRDARNAGASSPDKGKAPQGDDGASRGRGGEPRGDGKGTPGDDGAPSGSGSASPGSQDDVLDPEKGQTPPAEGEEGEEDLTPQEKAYWRRKARESAAELARVKAELETAKKAPPAAGTPPAVPTPPATPTPAPKEAMSYEKWLKDNPQPDKTKDMAGWLVWEAEGNNVWRQEQTQKEARTQEQTRVNTLVAQARQEIEEQKQAYAKTNPDFEAAFNHGKSAYTKAVKALMPHYTEAQIQQQFDKEIFMIAMKADRDKANLGEVLYDMAIERFGYVPSSGGSGNPTPPPSGQNPRPNLRVIQKNAGRSASPMSKGGGEGAKPRITLAQAAEMSPEELMTLDATDWDYLESQGVV